MTRICSAGRRKKRASEPTDWPRCSCRSAAWPGSIARRPGGPRHEALWPACGGRRCPARRPAPPQPGSRRVPVGVILAGGFPRPTMSSGERRGNSVTCAPGAGGGDRRDGPPAVIPRRHDARRASGVRRRAAQGHNAQHPSCQEGGADRPPGSGVAATPPWAWHWRECLGPLRRRCRLDRGAGCWRLDGTLVAHAYPPTCDQRFALGWPDAQPDPIHSVRHSARSHTASRLRPPWTDRYRQLGTRCLSDPGRTRRPGRSGRRRGGWRSPRA